jgi:Ca-activated chloride channel family protein
MNNFNPEDPKWTAYLLGECNEQEAKALESEVESNPDAAAWLKEMRNLESTLSGHFAHEPTLELQDLQKEQIRTQIKKRKPKGLPSPLIGIAAVLALLVTGVLMIPALQPPRQTIEVVDSIEYDLPLEDAAGEKAPAMDLPLEREETSTVPDPVQPPVPQAPPADAFAGFTSPAPEEEKLDGRLESVSEPLVSQPVRKALGLSRTRRQLNEVSSMSALGSAAVMMDQEAPAGMLSPSQDEFDVIETNGFRRVKDHPLSTFSIDVDTASYSVVRRMLNEGRLPPKDAVRIEEMINYFTYDYAAPTDGSPFVAHMQAMACPWAPEHRLVRVALKGKEIRAEERPPLNLVYLLDVSGSMRGGNRLPLVKRAMKTLVTQLDERDRVAIVVYAGAAGLVLPSTSGENDQAILEALDRLNAGGSTAGGAGIKLAYETAREQFVAGGVNRVILCTDGDFNVGLNQTGDLQTLIEKEAESGVQLTVLGFGMGNYKDDTLETLSNKGNGNYAFIDDFNEARKVLVEDLLGNMITIAKDVKIQIEFNPAYVQAYRLIGYENRMLKKEDFNNDNVDAGEIGAGHTVTALYELVPPGVTLTGEAPEVDELKYQNPSAVENSDARDTELLTLKLRHKHPDENQSVKTEFILPALQRTLSDADEDFRFASAVAAFGLWLRDPEFRQEMPIEEILELAHSARGEDALGYRSEFLQLVRAAGSLN